MRKAFLVLFAAAVLLALSAGTALANFGPHGGYAQDTDACAGCHRAHTSFSTLGWTDLQEVEHESALLVSDAATMTDFCEACHGAAAPGASTNVEEGVFDAGPTAPDGVAIDPSIGILYESNSSLDDTLNGGGFDTIGDAALPVLSTHGMDLTNQTTWGDIVDGVGTPGVVANFRCTSCHDPHGSSNYRLLKDSVNGRTVGGYDEVTPDPYVISNEEGYPTGGWKKGPAGVAQIAAYKPDYTTPQWSQYSGRSMSKWCAACHTAYVIENDNYAPVGTAPEWWSYDTGENAYDYGEAERMAQSDGTPGGALIGSQVRHRHPIDVPLQLGMGAGRALNVEVLNDDGLPLEMPLGTISDYDTDKPWTEQGNVTCLTCHRAHGTEAEMSGWATAKLAEPNGAPMPDSDLDGVNPNFSQALLRYDNRGVCERCHDK